MSEMKKRKGNKNHIGIGMGMNKDKQDSPEYTKKRIIPVIIGVLAVVITIFAGELFLY